MSTTLSLVRENWKGKISRPLGQVTQVKIGESFTIFLCKENKFKDLNLLFIRYLYISVCVYYVQIFIHQKAGTVMPAW